MAYRSTLVARGLPATLERVVASFLMNLRHARHGSARGIHEARVASRRLRELLRVVAPGRPADARSVRRAIRRLARVMGRVREIDVSLDLVASHPTMIEWPRAVRARVERACAVERARRHDLMVRRMLRVDLLELAARLRAIPRALAGSPPRSADAGIAAGRRQRSRALRAALHRAGTVYAPAQLHAVRIAIKKLRYSLEWSRASAGPGLAALLNELKDAQQRLGGIQDLHILEDTIRQLSSEPKLDRSTVRALHAGALRLEGACRELHAQFVQLLPRLEVLANDLARKTPLEWIRRRPARMSGLRPKAQGPRGLAPSPKPQAPSPQARARHGGLPV